MTAVRWVAAYLVVATVAGILIGKLLKWRGSL